MRLVILRFFLFISNENLPFHSAERLPLFHFIFFHVSSFFFLVLFSPSWRNPSFCEAFNWEWIGFLLSPCVLSNTTTVIKHEIKTFDRFREFFLMNVNIFNKIFTLQIIQFYLFCLITCPEVNRKGGEGRKCHGNIRKLFSPLSLLGRSKIRSGYEVAITTITCEETAKGRAPE